jgi:hypothetical protein
MKKEKWYGDMGYKEFMSTPRRKKWDEPVLCSTLVIVPLHIRWYQVAWYSIIKMITRLLKLEVPEPYTYQRHLHDSG